MHDVQGQLSIVDAGTIHAEGHAITRCQLGRKHRRLAEHDRAALADTHRYALRASRRGSWIRVDSGHRVFSGVRKLHESYAIGRTLQRLAGESYDLIDS